MTVIDRLVALADPTRGRLLLALDRHELAVGELAVALQLPQSTVSRHLKTLVDAGWVGLRADGASRRYRLTAGREGAPARELWDAVRQQLTSLPAAAHDAERLRAVVAERRSASRAFFSSAAAHWDRLRSELFGARLDSVALLALVDEQLVVGDLGCGTGVVADLLAPFVRRVVAVDHSAEMLALAREQLADRPNVEVRDGELDALPLSDGELDAALIILTLHHAPDPAAVLAEAARAVRSGGRVVVVDMLPHDREAFRDDMGHVWLGFSEDQLAEWLTAAGFEAPRYTALRADPAARGPALFAATARRAAAPARHAFPEAVRVGDARVPRASLTTA